MSKPQSGVDIALNIALTMVFYSFLGSFGSSKSMLQVHDAKDGDSFGRLKSSAYDGSVPIRQDDKMVNYSNLRVRLDDILPVLWLLR